MIGAILGVVLMAGEGAGLDPAALVEGLGSSRYLERESSEAALNRLGREALPSLRAATGAKDPEIRIRAAAILTRIEGTLLVDPTPLSFDFQRAPIAEAFRAINDRSGLSLRLSPENDPGWDGLRLTFRSERPLPFWEGLDALCEAGGFHYVLGGQAQGGARRDPAFPIYRGYAPPPRPVSDSGPFRTHLASVHYQSEIQLSRPRPAPVARGDRPASVEEMGPTSTGATRQFYLQLLIASQPRLSITQNGGPRISEAIDDHGQSLLIPATPATLHRSAGYYGINPSPLVRFRVDLAYPEAPGRRIKRIRGTMPLIVATRKPDPLKVVLGQSAGQTFRSPDVELTVREVRPARDGQPAAIDLTIKSVGGAGPIGEVDPMAARLESPQQQLEVLGAQGEPIPWFPSSTSFDGEQTRMTLSMVAQGAPVKPTALAYHGIIRGPAEVPFEFRDVPIP